MELGFSPMAASATSMSSAEWLRYRAGALVPAGTPAMKMTAPQQVQAAATSPAPQTVSVQHRIRRIVNVTRHARARVGKVTVRIAVQP
jgi:hypothetical protein